jgi:hypothetical protein
MLVATAAAALVGLMPLSIAQDLRRKAQVKQKKVLAHSLNS